MINVLNVYDIDCECDGIGGSRIPREKMEDEN